MIKTLHYHFELYQDSFLNDPVWSVEALSPFPALSTGDRFEHRGLALAWDDLPTVDEEFRVKDVQHLYWELDKELGHKLMVQLEIVPQTPDC
ncbi:hypothetical protein IFT47_04355 [Pseudomonas sp. CFBP 13711]|uniref:hypothetical protein n=1 Tax=unclassified Pseudomonas TaxID=196821 RepID=UPI00177D9519|nr:MULTISPECIES: hypothetical protein [unclassified Pseudomonas]MBD8705861.1 hypothetical protein [Pseudomonas sp. CFBP 13711]MBD8710440.1 hypothetical protein [Pseudomonas sp. CFBP 13715]